jgi:hypothetical protein
MLLASGPRHTDPPDGQLFRPLAGLASRAGLAGGGAQNIARYQPMSTHPSWVNIKIGEYQSLRRPVSVQLGGWLPRGMDGRAQ